MIALVRMTAALILWAGLFSLLYAVHGIGCAATEGGWLYAALFGIWFAGLVAHGLLFRVHRPTQPATLTRITRALDLTGLGATLVTGLPIILARGC